MPGTVILSHGSDSGPEATKVSALAKVAEELGWHAQRPDYRSEDAHGHVGSIQPRVEKLAALARAASRPPVLVGSSMGAFVSGLVSLQAPCRGMFLVALPMAIPRWSQRFDMAAGVSAMIVHGFDDELCPAMPVAMFGNARRIPTLLLPDDHRLSAHVEPIARQFRLFLQSLSA